MTTHVVVDEGKPTAVGVHYMDTLHNAVQHFEGAGFRGITGISFFDTNLDCNEARRRALDAAKRGEGKAFWQGAWDYSAGRCAIYRFDYTSYDGPRFKGNSDAAKLHVDCEAV